MPQVVEKLPETFLDGQRRFFSHILPQSAKDLYGIEAKDNIWFNGRTKELSHGGALGLDKAGPVGITHHWLAVDQTLDVMLDRGEIDACTAIRPTDRITAGDTTVIDRWGGTQIVGNPRLR